MTYPGRLVETPFANAVEDRQDLYLETGERELFIKACASSVAESTLREHLGERVEITGDLETSAWACGVYVQSRTGPYLVIEDIRGLE